MSEFSFNDIPMKELSFTEEFIAKYKAAIKARLSREQLSILLGIKPDSLRRRRLAIFKEKGLDLPQLEGKGDKQITQEQLEKFNVHYLELTTDKNKVKETTLSASALTGKRVFVITAAQNATPVHEEFLAAIKNYCEVRNAALIVIPFRYKNPTSVWTQNNENDEWWAGALEQHICSTDLRLAKRFRVMGHIPIQPTASEPLSGFDTFTGMDSGVFGHPKIQLKTVATPSQNLPKLLTTTGAITLPNYTDSKAGHKGDFHHSLAAVILEIDEDEAFYLRQIHADEVTGSFYDLNKLYTTNTVEDVPRAAALVTGDTHIEFIDEEVLDATYFAEDSIVKVLNPETRVYHDLIDFYSRNHHHRGNDIVTIGKHRYGRNNVEEGLQLGADLLDSTTQVDALNVVVSANHIEAFDRWLRESDPKFDPENAEFYHYMKYHQYKSIRMTKTGFESVDPFEFWCKNPCSQRGLQNKEQTHFLKRGESFIVKDIELGFHGDMGLNGSRGNIRQFSKIGPKTIIGHSHAPGIYEGVYQVGVSADLNLEYVRGQPNAWLHTHCIIYPDGKRTLIHIIKGKWKL